MRFSAYSRPTMFKTLEQRILLSGDSLLNIAPDPLQDALFDTMPQVVQYAELLETNEQVEEEINPELDSPDALNADIYQSIFTFSLSDDDADDEPLDVHSDSGDYFNETLGDLNTNNIGSA